MNRLSTDRMCALVNKHDDGNTSIKLIFGEPLLVLLIFGGMIRFMAGYAIGSYLPVFYSDIYPDFNSECKGGLYGQIYLPNALRKPVI